MWVSVYFEIRGEALPLESLNDAQRELKTAVNEALAKDCTCELILKP